MSLYGNFSRIVNKYPDSCAIEMFDGRIICYREFKEDIDSFINYITSELGDEKFIGIIDDQNYLAVVGIVATILAGKNIILVDPRIEQKRISDLLSKYTRFYFSELYKSIDNLELIEYVKAKNFRKRLNKKKLSDDGGYVIFTSGSTGEPRAVSASSHSLEKLAKVLIKKYYVNHTSNVVQFAYYGFDSSLAEIWMALLSGSTLLIPGKELRQNTYKCLQNLSGYENNIITLPPSFAKALDDRVLNHVDTLVLAGEECPATLANRCRKIVKHLINAYGPTESIICATTYEIKEEQKDRVPIGFPVDGVKIRLSENNELLINSKQLFDGYLGSKTDNCIKIHGKRWFNSGDLGKIRNDGMIEYLGRRDNQVKINGQRVELEGLEIELRKIFNVENLFVVFKRHEEDPELVIVLASKSDYERIRKTNVLSTYKMLPWRLVLVDDIPLSLNGKIDRKKLASMIRSNANVDFKSSDFSTISNKKLLKLWQEVFGALPKSENTGFFASGGDSLKALKLVKALNDDFGASVDLIDIIRDDYSLADLAKLVEKKNEKWRIE